MYTVMTNDIAGVDPKFERIGTFDSEVLVAPLIDLSLGIKGQKTCSLDRVEDCQNSLFLTVKCREDPFDVLNLNLFSPEFLYRYQGEDYVEMKYTLELNQDVTMISYFLLPAIDCLFAIADDGLPDTIDVQYLWKEGLIRRTP